MSLKFIQILLISFFLIFTGLPKYLNKKVNKEIESVFEIENFELQPIVFEKDIIKDLESDFQNENLMKILSQDRLVGYAYVSKALSKTDQFDYLVLLDKDLVIEGTKVLVYREDYGGEIGSKRWLKQFIGKTTNDKLQYGTDIMAISGATISVKSMTNAVDNLLSSLKILKSKNQI